ncbi:RNA polymerase sigma factor [Marivirga sp.]|uniref:RNA polymerase sigma factor n=1 Tax=Marivirga sp. TaxID=2018662 RepID=UPI003DA6E292
MLSLNQNRDSFDLQKSYFEELHKTYSKPIYHYLYSIVGDEELAKDLTQDTFIKLWNRRKQLNNVINIKSYLYKISKNLLLDHFKNEQYQNNQLKSLSVQSIEKKSPQYYYEENELEKIKQHALYSLSDTSRKVFLMSREGALSYQEISQKLGISKVAVKKQMMKALGILRQKLQPYIDIELIILSVLIFI